jgi:hypothetical protein
MMNDGTKVYKFATGFATGQPHFTTDPNPPGTPEQRANGVYGGLQATYTVRNGEMYEDGSGRYCGSVPKMTWN